MSNQILVIGSLAYDSIITPFGSVDNALGGSATYFSLASSLFAPTSVVAVVGADFKDADVLRRHKIDASGLQKATGKTFAWKGEYGFDLNTRRTLALKLNVFEDFRPKLLPHHKQTKMVFLANIHPRLQLEVLRQINRPNLIGLDTATEWINRTRPSLLRVLKMVDILVINDSEARELSGEHNLLKAAKKILVMMKPSPLPSPKGRGSGILIIKQGEHGLLMFQTNSPLPLGEGAPSHRRGAGEGWDNSLKIFNLPGYPLENVVDPTGAGDSFAGALMGYLAKTNDLSSKNLKTACATACAVASFTVEEFGTNRLQSIKLADVNNRLKQYKKLVNF